MSIINIIVYVTYISYGLFLFALHIIWYYMFYNYCAYTYQNPGSQNSLPCDQEQGGLWNRARKRSWDVHGARPHPIRGYFNTILYYLYYTILYNNVIVYYIPPESRSAACGPRCTWTPPTPILRQSFWIRQAQEGNIYFTELAERVEYGNYVRRILRQSFWIRPGARRACSTFQWKGRWAPHVESWVPGQFQNITMKPRIEAMVHTCTSHLNPLSQRWMGR